MSRPGKKRLQEGALSALRTPEGLPAPPKLVPLTASVPGVVAEPSGVDDESETYKRGLNSRLVQRAVRQAQAGDSDGIHFLYVRYGSDVQRYVASMIKDHHEAEDIAQNIFAKLMIGIKKYDDQNVPFTAWIMRVARNATLDHMRVKRDIPMGDPHVEEVFDETSREDLAGAQDLRQALEQLPEDQREVLILRHIAGLSPIEIAATLGKSESAVFGLHHRGRRTLQAFLTELSAQQHAVEEIIQE
jgi:RNA polymerase sigma-70 factor, ECF subfamily